MALFNDLFTESTAPVNENVDYLKDLPLAKFAEDASYLDCGSKGLVLAEAGWTDICETVNNMAALDESLEDVADKVKSGAEKAGAKIKSGAKRVVEFMKKVPAYLKKIAQNIFGTINKFLTSLAALVKNDQNILDLEAAKAGLKRYNDVNGKDALKIKGFLFDNGDPKGPEMAFARIVGPGSPVMKDIEDFAGYACDKKSSIGKEITAQTKVDILAKVRAGLVEESPANGDVTSKSFITDMKASYGSKSKEGVPVTDAILAKAVEVVKGGYKDGQKAARSTYKASKESINRWIKDCDDIVKFWEKKANDAKAENTKKDYGENAKAAELAGNIMMSCAGLMASYTGAFCQLLHQNYSSLRGALMTCAGYAKGGKVGKKVYGESDTSIFGLDLI